jgi:putative transposase
MTKNPFRYFKTSPEIIQLAVMMYVRFPLSLRNVEDLLHERGIDICHETVRHWVDRFGTYFAHKIRKRRSERMRQSPQWQWHLDEVFVKIRGKTHYLWRAVDHEGEVLESFRDEDSRQGFCIEIYEKSHEAVWQSQVVVTDKCPSYRAAMKAIGKRRPPGNGRHLNNRAENSHFHSDDESGRCPVSGACEVCRNSLQSIRLCTITSIIKGISRAGPGSNRYATPLFSNGASFLIAA